jgi:hypothetical protein
MIVLRGWGILVLAVPLAAAALVELVVNGFFGAGAYLHHGRWWVSLALALAALALRLLDRRLTRRPPQVLVDQATGQQVTFRDEHSLFFIPFEYWPAIWGGLAASGEGWPR